MTLKIVYSTDNYHPRVSGMATSIDRFGKYLRRRGHEIHVLAPRYPGDHLDDGNTHRFRSTGLFFSKEDRLVLPWERSSVFRVLDGIRPDIVHVQTEFEMGRLAMAWAKKRDVPAAVTFHTHWEQYAGHYLPFAPSSVSRGIARSMMRSLSKRADLLITPTPQMKEVLKGYGIEGEIHVVPTGIDADEFQGADKEIEKRGSPLFQKWPELKGKKVMAYLGRVGLEKNVDMLVEVLDRVVKEVPEAHLLVTGSGPYLEEMRAAVAGRGLEKKATFTGYVPRELVKNVLTIADVFVFPSLTETQGLVTGEAMCCGTPVVAVGEMGTKYFMGGDNGGFMVGNDAEEFSMRTVQLLTDHDLWERGSIEALGHARKWSMERLSVRMEDLYLSLLNI